MPTCFSVKSMRKGGLWQPYWTVWKGKEGQREVQCEEGHCQKEGERENSCDFAQHIHKELSMK